MGKLAVYKYFSFMLLVITLLLAIFTLFGLFGGNANPAKSTALAMLVYILPFLIIGNGVMALIWLIRRRWHWMAIPVLTIPLLHPIHRHHLSAGMVWQRSDFAQRHQDCHL